MLTVIICLVSVAIHCYVIANPLPQKRNIILGQPAPLYPFYVFISVGDFSRCGGTIVAPNVVVTAAHCLYNQKTFRWAQKQEVRVIDGDFTKPNWNNLSMSISCDRYDVHKGSNPRVIDSDYDIALIKLTKSFDISSPDNAILEPCPVNLKEPKYGTVIGVGLVNQNEWRLAEVLQETELEFDPFCSSYSNFYWLFNTQNLICYGNLGSGPCFGDSGGPLVLQVNGESKCLLGISSFSKSSTCGGMEYSNAFTKVGYYAEWIKYHLINYYEFTPSKM